MRSTVWWGAFCISALSGLVLAQSAPAAEIKASGSVSYVTVSSEADELADGRTLVRSTSKGIVRADDPTVSVHLSSQDCSGTDLIAAEGNFVLGQGYCDGVDKDGDVWWIWWRNSEQENVWGFLGGTGKYEGIEGGGTTAIETRLPDGRMSIRWQGTWQTK